VEPRSTPSARRGNEEATTWAVPVANATSATLELSQALSQTAEVIETARDLGNGQEEVTARATIAVSSNATFFFRIVSQ
jgi:hypothetical protein